LGNLRKFKKKWIVSLLKKGKKGLERGILVREGERREG